MRLSIPEFCLVVLIGAAGSGKTAFARRHFAGSEIVTVAREGSAPGVRTAITGAVDARLASRQLTVVDGRHLDPAERRPLLDAARRFHAPAIAIVLEAEPAALPDAPARPIEPQGLSHRIIAHQQRLARQALPRLAEEGFKTVITLEGRATLDAATVERRPTPTDRRHERGPFDLIGDVHGCADELEALLERLGYRLTWTGTEAGDRRCTVAAPHRRRAIFLGDLVDRGPRAPDVMRIVIAMAESGLALAVPGNHDAKFLRWLEGRNVRLTHGLELTAQQMQGVSAAERERMRGFLAGLPSHLWLDGGALAVAHAGLREGMIGRDAGAVREFCLYGDTSGEHDAEGLPIRYNWAAEYRGAIPIVYGHTPVAAPAWQNGTLCIDTGCCFGGHLTALRWPERELVACPAARVYAESRRAFGHPPDRPRRA